MMEEGSILDPSTDDSRSGFKMNEKRSGTDSESELARKRIKMRDLDLDFSSEGTEIHISESLGSVKAKNQHGKNKEVSSITEEPELIILDAFQTEIAGQNTLHHPHNASCLSSHNVHSGLNHMNLNTRVNVVNGSACDVVDRGKTSLRKADHTRNSVSSKHISLDLNADDAVNSAAHDPFYPYKPRGLVKSSEPSECGSSTGPLEDNESYRKWKEMKRNGFLSSAHGGIPMPAQPQPQLQRGKRKKNDPLKKKMEIAKREQVHRFTKAAAPSGLLNGLNPGIINHVRNSKQVHSIIEALVRSERRENSIQSRLTGHLKGGMDTNNEKGKDPEKVHDLGVPRVSVYHKADHAPSGNLQTKDNQISCSVPNMSLISEHKGGCGDFEVVERRGCDETCGVSHPTSDGEDEMLSLKLSSSITTASENDDSTNHASVSSLSAKAATVASQWLELLYQDIKGRLAALRRSKKRVQAVVQTELPFLIMKEFSSTKEEDPYFRQSPSHKCPNTLVTDMHRARWTALFDQMDKALSEEGKHLEIWLDQVKEMQVQCERGLQGVNWHTLLSLGATERDRIKVVESTEKELAVRAAAASIYSTCNFVKATEDVSCF